MTKLTVKAKRYSKYPRVQNHKVAVSTHVTNCKNIFVIFQENYQVATYGSLEKVYLRDEQNTTQKEFSLFKQNSRSRFYGNFASFYTSLDVFHHQIKGVEFIYEMNVANFSFHPVLRQMNSGTNEILMAENDESFGQLGTNFELLGTFEVGIFTFK